MLELHWTYWFVALIPLGMLGLLCLAITGMGSVGYKPMSSEEEYDWLRENGLTHEEAKEIMQDV